MKNIVETGVHIHIGFPAVINLKEFNRVYDLFKNDLKNMPNSITMICTLLNSTNEVIKNFIFSCKILTKLKTL